MSMGPSEKRNRGLLIQSGIILLLISMIFYILARSIFVAFAHYGLFERILAILFLSAESFLMLHAIGYFSNVFFMHSMEKEISKIPPLTQFPPVAILVPARHEPKDVLRQTFQAIKSIDYPNKDIYFLDDSSDQRYKDEAKELCNELGLHLFQREGNRGAKAGIINDCVKTLTDKYIVVFDSDQCPVPGFLLKLVPYLESDPKLALVQTPQFYSNLSASRVAFATNMQQAVFYEYICEGKSSKSSMICCGTNVILRREALMEVGGLDESTVTEDFATSLKFHALGWKTFYHGHVGTFGMGPKNLGDYFKQQNRWALGNVMVFRRVVVGFFRNPHALSPMQWFEYFLTGSYYFVGWAYLLLVLFPILYVFFKIPSFFMDAKVYSLSFFPYFLLAWGIYFFCMSTRHYRFGQMLKAQALSFITLPIYAKASLMGLLGVKSKFQITGKGESSTISYWDLKPQLILWALSLAALTWAFNRMIFEKDLALGTNIFWIAYHLLLLSTIFYFNEEWMDDSQTFRSVKWGVSLDYRKIKEGVAHDTTETKGVVFIKHSVSSLVNVGDLLMCKVRKGQTPAIIFDAVAVMSTEGSKDRSTVGLRVIRISQEDKDRLKRMLR
jgi:cellulose synthase (UDP-forming)